MTKKLELCDHCGAPLGQARVVVHDPDPTRPSGAFHNSAGDNCYTKAVAASEPKPSVLQTRALHSDVETICGEST